MAYRLKSVRYQNSPRKILLQNENGPCPLLACANALLLRGVISLPSACIRNGVASIDDVVNILGERALKRAGDQAEAAKHGTEWKEVSSKKKQSSGTESKVVDPLIHHGQTHEHHIHELLSLFPNLQYGMDVNPKFTQGPAGVEYTMNITAFDLLGVELVHGWLLDPQDAETSQLVGSKSYNELIEFVVHSNEAGAEAERLSGLIKEKERALKQGFYMRSAGSPDKKENVSEDDEWVNVPEENRSAANGRGSDVDERQEHASGDTVKVDLSDGIPALKNEDDGLSSKNPAPAVTEPLTDDDRISIEKELDELQTKHQEKVTQASKGSIVNTFLTSTGHQLTYHGLHELHKHVAEECLCVFFRNNHFATMTKHEGVLYLLVTDLGYANVNEVVWEKLDSIDGDTELFDEYFVRPKPRASLAVADGPALSPEALLAQRGRSEADYQLALQLSSKGGGAKTRAEMDEEEGKLIAAATEASLKEWNGKDGNSDSVPTTPVGEKSESIKSPSSPEDADRAMALALYAEINADNESEMLARQLQAEENHRARAARQRGTPSNGRPVAAMAPDQAAQPSSSGSSCVIS